MVFIYIFFLLFQLLNTYIGVLAPFNPYVFCVIFILYGFKKSVYATNVKILRLLLVLIISFILIYSVKFSFTGSFLIAAKAIQFNFGYFLLIPGFCVLFRFFPKVKLKQILAITFWVITSELLLEFVLIRILGVSPGAFTHYPKVAHITLDEVTGVYTANRLLGMAGNASVTGVLYTASFVLYLGYLYSEKKKLFDNRNLVIIGTFTVCFFMIVSGSAFFAILLSTFVVWSQRKGNLVKNLIIALLIIPIILLLFSYISTVTDAFGDKFTIDYLMYLLQRDDVQGSLPYIIHEMSIDYQWYNFFIGSYYFEWGNPDAVIRTVDYFYVNLVYEFGLIGLCLFFYVIRIAYNSVRKLGLIEDNYLKFGFLVIILGSLHYPAIAYMASQIFISAIAGISMRDYAKKKKLKENLIIK